MVNYSNTKICIMGLGYIGLPTAALLANKGYNIHGVDVNQRAIETINKGLIHIVEPDLDIFVRAAVESGKLKAHKEPNYADIFFICVPTPFKNGNKTLEPDLSYVINATEKISTYVKPGNIIIVESTSPVGTTEKVGEILKEKGIDLSEIMIAYCPERVLPGKIMSELIENDRIIGGLTDEATKKVSEFYKTFVIGKILQTNSRTAEMCKLVENSSRDVQIAFANELSMICADLDIDIWELIDLANHHPRVNILNPGPGVGGHCLAVDPWFIVAKNPELAKLIRSAREINLYKTLWTIEKIKNSINEFIVSNDYKPTVVCMGLSFKPDIDDLRESPSLKIAEEINMYYDNVKVVEPNIEEIDNLDLITIEEAEKNGDIIVVLVSHKEFKDFNYFEKKTLIFCDIK